MERRDKRAITYGSQWVLDTVLGMKFCRMQQENRVGVAMVVAGTGKEWCSRAKGYERPQRTASGKPPTLECLGSSQQEESLVGQGWQSPVWLSPVPQAGRTRNTSSKNKGLELDLKGVWMPVSPFLSDMTIGKLFSISLPLISSPIKSA